MTFASESTHWYAQDGSPCYEVPAKDGSMRPTTVRDARTLGLVPSVTTIIRCADRPGLTNWMIDQAILAALTLPRSEDEQEELWLARVKRDSKEQARKAAERGTEIHAAIESYYRHGAPMSPYVRAAVKSVYEWIQYDEYGAEKSFCHPMGFGGKVDLHGPGFVVDYKTKEFTAETTLKTWDEHALQLAAYREGLGLPTARCAIVYVSTSTPGLARLLELPEQDLARGWECFKSLLSYWQAKNKYWPGKKAA